MPRLEARRELLLLEAELFGGLAAWGHRDAASIADEVLARLGTTRPRVVVAE